MLAQQYDGNYDLAARGVALTAILAVVTMPVVSVLMEGTAGEVRSGFHIVFRLVENLLLLCLTFLIEAFEHIRVVIGVDDFRGGEELERGNRVAETSGGVDARRKLEGDVRRLD